MTLGARANVKVRAERGGDEAARARTDALKAAWPRDVVKHCDALLAGPMPPTTYEALLAVCGWRADQPIPEHARYTPRLVPKRRPGRPRLRTGGYIRRQRSYQRATQRALRRLKRRHAAEYRTLYQEERRNEAASTKETA